MLRRFSKYSGNRLSALTCSWSRRCLGMVAADADLRPAVEHSMPSGLTEKEVGGMTVSKLTPAAELEQLSHVIPRQNLDPKCSRHCNVALRLLIVAEEQYTKSGTPSQWLSKKRREQLRRFQLSHPSPATAAEEEEDSPPSAEPSAVPRSQSHSLVNLLSTYIRYEGELEAQKESGMLPQRLRAKNWQDMSAPFRLDSLERQYVLHLVCNVVEKKEIALVIVTRLLRRRWPASIMDVTGAAHHRFLVKSIFSWIAEEIQKDTIGAQDARAILDNSAFALKNSGAMLVGKLAMISIRDLHEKENAEAFISLMWSVNSSGVHAPDSFWRQIFVRLTELNRTKRGCTEETKEDPSDTSLLLSSEKAVPTPARKGASDASEQSVSRRQRSHRTHVFSGLTTRQIYRILAVLKKERWSGEAGDMHELADQALKNIVFEAEALALSEEEQKDDIPKRVLADRLRSLSDLSFQEFLTLLIIAGDLGVPFHISALRVSDILFVPFTRFLDQQQLLSLLVVVRQTRCYSPSLMNVIAQQIQRRGTNSPYALPLTKAYIRAITKEKSLWGQASVTEFTFFFFELCRDITHKVRLSELGTLADVVYGIYRCHASESTIGQKCKETIEGFCHQADRLLQLQLTSLAVPSKLLEVTMVMGMRSHPKYPCTSALHQTRNAASATNNSRLAEDVALLGVIEEQLLDPGKLIAEEEEKDPLHEEKKGKRTEEFIVDRWASQGEEMLPAVPKAALHVYNELIYFFEKMVVVKSDITSMDWDKFRDTMEQTGLYNIFLGAYLMQQAHLSIPNSPNSMGGLSSTKTLPASLQRRVHKFIKVKTTQFKSLSGKSFTDQELLHTLGQVHCQPEKIEKFLLMIQRSPLDMSKQQRDLWIYVDKLVERFGNESEKKKVKEILGSCVF